MKRILISALLLALPLAAHSYGTRNWLQMNQEFSPEVRDQHYNFRGYNRMTGTRRTTSWSAEDQLRWMYEGNVRNHNSTGIYHWKKRMTREK